MHPFYQAFLDKLEELHKQLGAAIEGLPPAALDWAPGPQMNSIGVLVAHTAGSERYLLGDLLAQQPTGRDRPAEFLTRGLSAAELNARLADSRAFARGALERLTIADLTTPRMLRNGRQVAGAWALLHVLDHTGEHLGHIEITRQLWGKGPAA
jgi:hypothetical protein